MIMIMIAPVETRRQHYCTGAWLPSCLMKSNNVVYWWCVAVASSLEHTINIGVDNSPLSPSYQGNIPGIKHIEWKVIIVPWLDIKCYVCCPPLAPVRCDHGWMGDQSSRQCRSVITALQPPTDPVAISGLSLLHSTVADTASHRPVTSSSQTKHFNAETPEKHQQDEDEVK